METWLFHTITNTPAFGPLLFILARFMSVVIPMIPGIAIDVVGIAVFGKIAGFIYAEIGLMLGSMVSFSIARYFKRFIERWDSYHNIAAWESKFSENQEFWTLTIARVIANPFFDLINYAAGLTKIKFWKFVLSTFLGSLPVMVAIYSFGGLAFNNEYWAILLILTLIVFLLYKFKRRK